MSRPTARRTAVIAYSSRSREHIRRALRALGHAPLVFSSLDEFMAMRSAAPAIDALVLGDAPDIDSQGRAVVECALGTVGSGVPVLHAQMQKRVRSRRRIDAPQAVEVASPRYFSDLYQSVHSFLDRQGVEGVPRPLVWGRYSFDPLDKHIGFNDQKLKMDAVDFDIALEFFFNAGRPLTTKWLTRMLPSGEHGANWHRIDNLGCTIEELRIALELDGSNGCTLESSTETGCHLLRVRPAPPRPVADRTLDPARALSDRRVASRPVPELST